MIFQKIEFIFLQSCTNNILVCSERTHFLDSKVYASLFSVFSLFCLIAKSFGYNLPTVYYATLRSL